MQLRRSLQHGLTCNDAHILLLQFAFITCCVRSNELDANHRQSLAETLIERNWRKTSNCVTHNCACNLRSQRTRSVRRGVVSEPDVCQLFGLVGVPTLIMLDSSGNHKVIYAWTQGDVKLDISG